MYFTFPATTDAPPSPDRWFLLRNLFYSDGAKGNGAFVFVSSQNSASLTVNGTLNKRSYTQTHTHTLILIRDIILLFSSCVYKSGGTGKMPSPTRELIRRGFAYSNLRILINAARLGDLWPGKWDFLSF